MKGKIYMWILKRYSERTHQSSCYFHFTVTTHMYHEAREKYGCFKTCKIKGGHRNHWVTTTIIEPPIACLSPRLLYQIPTGN